MPTPSTFWTAERHDAMVALIGQGLSTAKVAEALGDGCTKNMVIGRSYRHACELSDKRASLNAKRPPTLDERLKWHLVEQKGCAYILGDPRGEWRWCGEPTMSIGSPYCAAHHAVCWQKPESRGKSQ